MPDWINRDTFDALKISSQQLFLFLEDLSPDWVGFDLDPAYHLDLYQYFFSGGEILYRANTEGELEFIILLDEETEPINVAKAGLGLEILESEPNRFSFGLLIYDRDDDPFDIPFIFNLDDPHQRYCAAALCEQQEISIFFLKRQEEHLQVAFGRPLQWSDKVRNGLRELIIDAYQPIEDAETEIDGLYASDVAEEDLIASGWGYQFDLAQIRLTFSEDGLSDFIDEMIGECSSRMANMRNKGVNKGPFMFWVNQREGLYGASGEREEGLVLLITPFYNDRSPRATTELEPCFEYLMTQPGYLRVESGNPIFENALPVYRYENGELETVYVDDMFCEFASHYQSDLLNVNRINRNEHFNIYQHLLENRQLHKS